MKKKIFALTLLTLLFVNNLQIALHAVGLPDEDEDDESITLHVTKITPGGDLGLGPFNITVTCTGAFATVQNFTLNNGETKSFTYPSGPAISCTVSETLSPAQAAEFTAVYGDTYDVNDGIMVAANSSSIPSGATFTVTNIVKSKTQPLSPPGNNSRPGSSPSCDAQKPGSAPSIASVVRNGSKATLSIVPGGDPFNYYYISYGVTPSTEGYGVKFAMGKTAGIVTYTINDLDPKQSYSFKVRAGHDCQTGDWSNSQIAINSNLLPRTGR